MINPAPKIPNQVIIIKDDAAARKFLTECDLLEIIERNCAITHAVTAASKVDHLTHWILAIKFDGYSAPADNGFIVCAWPKSRFTENVMSKQLGVWKINAANPDCKKSWRRGDPTGLQ